MKKKKNIIDNISLLMMDTSDLENDNCIMEYIEDIQDVDMRGRDGRTLLIHACTYNRRLIAHRLIERKAELNMQDDMGYSALHACVISNNFDCARLLIQAGANINLCDNIGNVPLFYVSNNAFDMLHLLLSHGADCDTKNIYDISPLDTFQANPTVIQIFNQYKREG